MTRLNVADRLKVYTRYIGQKIILTGKESGSIIQTGFITGVNSHAIQVNINQLARWVLCTTILNFMI